jgi:hypothetical protein
VIIAIDDSVFLLSSDVARRRLISLVQSAEDRGHHVHHADGDPLPAGSLAERALGASSSLMPAADRTWIAECLRNGFQAAQSPNASRRLVRIHDKMTDWSGPTPILSMTDAQDYVVRSVEVLVENSQNDRRFLECWVPPARALDFKTALQRSTVDFKNGGGLSGIGATLEGAKQRKEHSFLHRALAIFDSDTAEPGPPPKHVTKCEGVCTACLEPSAANPRFHRLKRRAIENYLPHAVLDDYVAGPGSLHVHPRAVASLRALGPTSDHARYYHMKAGLVSDLADNARKKAYKARPNLAWSPADARHLPAHWQGALPIALETLLHGFSDHLAAWSTEKMVNGSGYTFDADAQREADDVFAMMLSWV